MVKIPSQMIEAINEIFQVHDEPYKLTNFVKVEFEEGPIHGFPASNQRFSVIKTLSYPQVIFTEDEVVHEEAVAPALAVLGRPYFQAANGRIPRWFEALQDRILQRVLVKLR